MNCPAIFVGFFLLLGTLLPAQPGFEVLKDVKKIDIPFEYQNNLIIVNVVFNRLFPLKFIFDTGAENTILSDKSITDLLDIRYEREFKIMGSDMRTELKAYLIRGIHLRLEDMVAPSQTMLVLEEDYFRFHEMTGLQIHGILGADLFKGLVVKVNYDRKVITLMKSSSFKPSPSDYRSLPLKINKNKPYLETTLQVQRDSSIQVKLLLDTGAMIALLLNTETHPDLKCPPNAIQGNIGAGLGGFIEGYLGRVHSLSIGDLDCHGVLTNFQTLGEGVDASILQGRNGIIGNGVLSRFNFVIDYPSQMFYFQPNRRFHQKFEFDKSGLVIIAADVQLNQFFVHSVLPNSPAAEAGIQPGDQIKRLNASSANFLSLIGIQQKLKKKEGKKIKIVVKRGSRKMKFQFRLRNLI